MLACATCGSALAPTDGGEATVCASCRTQRSAVLAQRSHAHEGADAARIPLTETSILDLLRQHFPDSVFFCPDVPAKRQEAARAAHVAHLPAGERILALYDATILGHVHEGFVVTARRLCWRNSGGPSSFVLWADIDPDALDLDGCHLYLGDQTLGIAEPEVLEACANVLHVLAISGRSPTSGLIRRQDTVPVQGPPSEKMAATPPPPHTTSFLDYASHATSNAPDCSCWRCYTPLHAKAPDCKYCGALRKKTGWLRTG